MNLNELELSEPGRRLARLGLSIRPIHRRISVFDVRTFDHQPIWSADEGVAIVFDAEKFIYRKCAPGVETSPWGSATVQ